MAKYSLRNIFWPVYFPSQEIYYGDYQLNHSILAMDERKRFSSCKINADTI